MIDAATVVVHGTVTGLNQCVSTAGTDVFTFVTLDVEEVLRGQPVLTGAGTFTFRLPLGQFPDDSYATSVGYPRFDVGDQVVVFLTYGSGGAPLRWPLAFAEESVVRVLPSATRDFVVDGSGAPFLYTERPVLLRGEPVAEARSQYWFDPALDASDAAAALAVAHSGADWNGTGFAAGDWRAVMVIKGTDVASGESSQCNAHLSGQVTSSSFYLTGRCNAAHVGAALVVLQGNIGAGGWWGTITARSTALPSEPQTTFLPLAGGGNESFRASLSGQTTEEGVTVDWTVDFQTFFAGDRPLATWADVRGKLLSVIASLPPSTTPIPSVSPTQATCDAPVVLTGGTP